MASTPLLADSAVIDTKTVEQIALSVEGVQSCHKIRSRGTNGATYLDLHIQSDGQISLEAGHELGHNVQERLKKQLGVSARRTHRSQITNQ